MRLHGDSLLEESIKELSPMARGSPVEPKSKFFKIMVKMVPRYSSLVYTEQPAFEQGSDSMYTWQDLATCTAGLMDCAGLMNIPLPRYSIIGLPTVSYNDGSWCHNLLYKVDQVLLRGLGDLFEADPAHPLPSDFNGNDDDSLAPRSPARDMGSSTDKNIVHLYRRCQMFTIGPHHRPAQLMQARPGAMIASQSQGVLHPQSAHPRLLIRKPPYCSEPEPQGEVAAMKDGSSGYGYHGIAILALPELVADPPSAVQATLGASEPIWPANFGEVSTTIVLGPEFSFEFQQVPREESCHRSNIH